MRYYAEPLVSGSPANRPQIRAVMDAPEGGSQIGVAFAYGVLPGPDLWLRIILRGDGGPEVIPGRFRLADGELTLIEGTEQE